MKGVAALPGRKRLRDKEGSSGATMKGAFARQGRQRRHDDEDRTGGATMKGANFYGRHDNGDGRSTAATGGTTMRHDSSKGQQGDRMHDDFDGRHDDDKRQQGNMRRDNQQRRRTGSATMKGVAA
jgi:hypothetical protein